MSEFKLARPMDIVDSPTVELYTGTGRARCRVCGEKIAKGADGYAFFVSFTDGGSYNAWTAVEGKCHRECMHKHGYRMIGDTFTTNQSMEVLR